MGLARRLFGLGALAGAGYWLVRYFRPQHSTLVLSEKVVLITGASSGIGRALAYAFARRGARVVLVARREERLEAVRREIEPYTSDVLVIPADISDEAQLQRVVEQTLEHFGRVDVLVNNAGVSLAGWLQDLPPKLVERVLRVNLLAAIRLTQLVLPHMLEQRGGYILNIGSILGRTTAPLFSVYNASKFGMTGFSSALRRELDRTGVYVTLALPGWTRTEMVSPEIEDLARRYGYNVQEADEVAERIVLGLVHGDDEIVLGGFFERVGIFLDCWAPWLMRLYWKLWFTPEWVSVMGGELERALKRAGRK